MERRMFLYSRFERFWHWAQAALVLALIYTGFEVHGTLDFLGYRVIRTQLRMTKRL